MTKLCRNRTGFVVLLATCALVLFGCESIKNSMPWENVNLKMESYADARYRKAIRYMKESRFELAQEQFAIVAATANSSELRELGLEGYSKANKAIAVKR